MKAVSYHRYGATAVLELGDVPAPRPGPTEVLVRVVAAALNPKDVLVRKGKFKVFTGMTRRRFPLSCGYDFAGEIVERGARVSTFAVSDQVYGMINGWRGRTCAELVAVPATELALKPPALSMTEAAAVPLAALTALQALRDLLALQPGQRLCVNGASGGVGTFAVQLAAAWDAEVVAVCSAKNAALVRELGAREVIDYTVADPLVAGPYQAFFDVFGNKSLAATRRALTPHGRSVTTVPRGDTILRDLSSRWSPQQQRLVIVRSRRRDLEQLSQLIEAGKLRPVIDQVLPLAEIAAAHAALETKRTRGKIVLRVAADEG